ncbi:MAG TPA: M48 family metalloprotease [Syntrophorhabdaceae bacterium]|nr:M48 family metalloprotease [Syntrophorhabdaceae bacterium]HQM81833.1 M48 family metalloprotease [Syntrophorhabdaceae bacterium]
MKTLRFLLVFFLILITFTLFGSCAVNPVTGQSQLMLLSEADEIAMGREVYPNALWGGEGGGGEYRDDRLKAYLKGLVINIHKASHRPNLPVDFAIQDSSVPNAWAIPGYVVMTRGLLANLNNEAEFVYVMGHEMGHVSARHSASQMSKGMLTQMLLGGAGIALAGTDYSDAALTLGSLGGSLLLLKYSRSDELEADRLGVQYMTRLGYDPRNALNAQRNIEKIGNEYGRSIGQEPGEQSFFQDLLSTHPRTSVRVEEMQNIINSTPRQPIRGDGTNRQQFQSATADIRKMHSVYTNYYDKGVRTLKKDNLPEATSYAQKALAQDQKRAPFHALNGFIMLKRKNYSEAEKSFQQALRIDPNYQPAVRGMGAKSYFQGNYTESVQYLRRSLTLFPEDLSSFYFLGMSYYRTKSYQNAIAYLKPFADAQPKHPRVHGILGMCYEGVGDINNAYAEHMKQSQIDPKSETGKASLERSKALRLKYGR